MPILAKNLSDLFHQETKSFHDAVQSKLNKLKGERIKFNGCEWGEEPHKWKDVECVVSRVVVSIGCMSDSPYQLTVDSIDGKKYYIPSDTEIHVLNK